MQPAAEVPATTAALTNDGLDLQAGFLTAHPGSSIVVDAGNTRVNLGVVPEPDAALLMCAGWAALLVRRKKATRHGSGGSWILR